VRAPQDWSQPDPTAVAALLTATPGTRLVTASGRVLARGLGNAFLAGPWEPDGMQQRAATVVGRRKWLKKLVEQVLEVYPRPPVDRPRELADFVAECEPVLRALRQAARSGRTVPVRRIPPAPTQMARRRWPVPILDGESDLAALLGLDVGELTWFADVKGLQRRAPSGPLHHYRYTWQITRSGRPRLLEAPLTRLRQIQRTVLDEVLNLIPVHPAAHGFVAGRSAVTSARVHTGADVVVSLDLTAFFSSLDAGRVYGVFRAAGYPQPVAYQLTGLCTTRTPIAVLSAMPTLDPRAADPGEWASARFQHRQLLATAHLPQGAPTSPALANLCVARLDRRLSGYAAACGAVYTRYADDLTFSSSGHGASGTRFHPDRLLKAVTAIVAEEGLRVQPAKTRVQRAHQRQTVTGIVVNTRTNLPRREYDELKALLHNAVRYGGPSQNRAVIRTSGRICSAGSAGWSSSTRPAPTGYGKPSTPSRGEPGGVKYIRSGRRYPVL
jgi:RNA-directed DNA polymerase